MILPIEKKGVQLLKPFEHFEHKKYIREQLFLPIVEYWDQL